jgi:UTP--glucose-1-phosphate uridylyltransferase
MRVRKAVIPAAGLGTRLLPASKAVPKELLPLVDRPMIHYIVEEALDAGITQFIIVTSTGKEALADYFDPSEEIERLLSDWGLEPPAAALARLRREAEFVFVRQHQQLGLGHAVLVTRNAVGDEPFAVMLPDDIVVSAEPAIGQLVAVASERDASVVAVESVPRERVSAYGVIDPEPLSERVYRVRGMVEKPPPEEAPSDLAIVGRYVLTPDVFDALARVRPGAKGEIQLTDAVAMLIEGRGVYACRFNGARYDAGNPLGLIQTSVALALDRDDTGPALRAWLRGRLAEG